MVARGLDPDFAPKAVHETSTFTHAAVDDSDDIRDLRALLWCSIDNDDSRDLDQLSVALPAKGLFVRILVAVADVDALVHAGSAIDAHAQANTTSVYTAAQIFPMLPERCSTDLTSLNEGEDRLAMVTDMTVAEDGTVVDASVYRAHVRNHAQLAYNSVADWLDGTAPAPPRVLAVPGLDDVIRTQDRIAQAMKELRHQAGALTLQTTEARAVFEGDELADLRADERNRAKDLIEDFMIAVNAVTARTLDRKGFPSLRRVLRSPERWQRIVELAASLDGRLPPVPSAVALEAFLQERRKIDPKRFVDLSLSVIKLLGRGEYALDLPGHDGPGHFGLAVKDYTHSTAPNRRFPDLITQRLLKAALAGRPQPYSVDDLQLLAQHCTAQEDAATKVERAVRKSAAAILLERRIGEHFDATVTGANEKGTWVRINHPAAEGKLVRGERGLDVGQHVRVELVRTDVEDGFVDFVRAGHG
jgi:exoribonuclease-2